ncbi:MAG: hypothetical protein A2Z18_11115 [Armatimonadetes bacterium RBG_16_58_9]|nr:MAG: hypothetical protein A2Z18_11115 [Armatimonadetes bacterium RBG_16_58_9]
MRDYRQIADQYARDVVDDKIPSCHWIKLACQRQLDDLARTEWHWRFDANLANAYCQFVELLPHVKGRWDSPTIRLQPWQIFFIATAFGWVDDEGFRRFRKALLVVGRGNSKSTMAAALALAVLCIDNEPGAGIYSAARTRDQAKVVWLIAHAMTTKTQGLRDAFGVLPMAHAITREAHNGTFRALSRDAQVSEGESVHMGIVDEIHAHPDRTVYDVVLHGMRARKQPLLLEISTEGDDRSGILVEEVDYLKDVLRGLVDGERFFGLYYTLDIGDDWTSPIGWLKANPNLNVSVFEDELLTLRDQALANPGAQASFKTKRCNIRHATMEGYFNMLAWDGPCRKPGLTFSDVQGWQCFFGVDLASEIDIAALSMVFRNGGNFAVFGRYYLPENAIIKGTPNYDRYRGWASAGSSKNSRWLTLTPGNVIDFEFIEEDLVQLAGELHPRAIGYDPYQATEMSQRMEKRGLAMIKVPATVAMFSEPMKRLGSLITSGRIKHDGDPVLAWMMGNIIAREDAKENVYPRKGRPDRKIDGAIATMIALNRAIAGELRRVSIYDQYAAEGGSTV